MYEICSFIGKVYYVNRIAFYCENALRGFKWTFVLLFDQLVIFCFLVSFFNPVLLC